MQALLPEGWATPVGYTNGIAVDAGRIVFIAGQVGWNAQQRFESSDIVAQLAQALKNVLAVLAEAGGRPEHIAQRLRELRRQLLRLEHLLRVPAHLPGDEDDATGLDGDTVGVADRRLPA